MRIALTLLLASFLGLAAPVGVAADDRFDDRARSYERHGDYDRDARPGYWHKQRSGKRWYGHDRHKYRDGKPWYGHDRHQRRYCRDWAHRPHRSHSYRPSAYVVYRQRVPVQPYFSISLRFP
ncbi:MAG: hypothetical protein GWO11_04105 [Desulfuromonadales bacterium]|nr:hypothetical protein [Desulfuromonadales bacterium]NIR33612.1 hypothetical protein [Desulfuromonadales bacterium]NIS43989.1 hypothetical protein [Desulfuromonadales bacterium]